MIVSPRQRQFVLPVNFVGAIITFPVTRSHEVLKEKVAGSKNVGQMLNPSTRGKRMFENHIVAVDERESLNRRFTGLHSRFDTSTETEVLNFVGNRIPLFQPSDHY